MFIWKDPFGRLMRFNNSDYLPAQLAEPIIYLYPVLKQRIDVMINPVNGVVKSIPKANDNNIWEVVALPNGEITNLNDNKKYPYIFWEGLSVPYKIPQNGYVINKKSIKKFLENQLSEMGLNDSEIKDFLKAWLPSLTKKDYCFISFVSESEINKLAPLTIIPQPDTIIRVLMEFKAIDKPINVMDSCFRRNDTSSGTIAN